MYVYHEVKKGVVWLQYYIMCVYEYVCIVCIIMYMYVYLLTFIILFYIRTHWLGELAQ